MSHLVLALDQGTTSSRAMLFNERSETLGQAQQEFSQIYPQPGWVEHDPEAIWDTQLATARAAIACSGRSAAEIAAIGIANQRETTVLWERESGRPVANAIVWQSRHSEELCRQLRSDGLETMVRSRTGLVIDPYFSGTKIRWLLDNIPGLRTRAERGDILFGTIDSFLIWRLSGGRVHATDFSNASRTMLFNIHDLEWDEELLRLLQIPRAMLPDVCPSSGIVATTDPSLLGVAVPVAGIAGDQQAATFGQGCFEAGHVKNTYGTGCFVLMNTGDTPVASEHGLLTTIAWNINGRVTYCLEGSVFISGAVVQWLRDGLGIIDTAAESEALASAVEDTGGVSLVPAFVGLGAPWWDSRVRGTILGITRGTTRGHLARAALESIAFQTRDVIDAMQRDSGVAVPLLRVDGGAAANNLLMQIQADVLGIPVHRPQILETTALGAAYLAGLATGVWNAPQEILTHWQLDREFLRAQASAESDRRYATWKRAVASARAFAES